MQPLAPFHDRLLVLSGMNAPMLERLQPALAGLHRLSDGHAARQDLRRRRPGLDLARSAGRPAFRRTDAAALPGAGPGQPRRGGAVRRQSLHHGQRHLLAHARPCRCRRRTTRGWCSSGCSAMSGSTETAARLAHLRQDRSILDFVIGQVGRPAAQRWDRSDRSRLEEYLDGVRDIETRIQKAEAQSAKEMPVVTQPVGHSGHLRGTRQADVRPAGAGLSVGPDAGDHLHVRPRIQRPRLSGDRRARGSPPPVAPPERPGQAGSPWPR